MNTIIAISEIYVLSYVLPLEYSNIKIRLGIMYKCKHQWLYLNFKWIVFILSSIAMYYLWAVLIKLLSTNPYYT